MKKMLFALLGMAVSSVAVAGVKGTIMDTGTTQYIGAKLSGGSWATSSTDSMGGAAYDLQSLSYDYDKTSHMMTVTIDAGQFRDGVVANNSPINNGDLFLHFNLNSPANVVPTGTDRSDLSSTSVGVDWNDGFGFVFDTSASKIYGGSFGMQYSGTSGAAGISLPSGGNAWTGDTGRNGQEVGYNSGGTEIANNIVGNGKYDAKLAFNDDHKGKLTYTFDLQKLASTVGVASLDSKLQTGSLDLSARWTMTCANDVLQGRFQIPEPSAVLMLGLGLIGLFGMRRRA